SCTSKSTTFSSQSGIGALHDKCTATGLCGSPWMIWAGFPNTRSVRYSITLATTCGLSCCRRRFQISTPSTSRKTSADTSWSDSSNRAFTLLTAPGFRPAPCRLPPCIRASASLGSLENLNLNQVRLNFDSRHSVSSTDEICHFFSRTLPKAIDSLALQIGHAVAPDCATGKDQLT